MSMTFDELETVALRAIRFRASEWISSPSFNDRTWYVFTSAIMYDFARLRCLVERAQNGEPDSAASALESLRQQFAYDPEGTLPPYWEFWPEGLEYKLQARQTQKF